MSSPELSIVVIVFNMQREAPRALHSLSPAYQVDVEADRYEVVVIDNGSDVPLGEAVVEGYGSCFRYEHIANAAASPARAMNRGVEIAAGKWLGLMIDGARIVTPGVISSALSLLELSDSYLIETIGYHIGPDMQVRSVQSGYDRATEDALLADIGWPTDGYRLFEIAALAGSCKYGIFGSISESNCMFLSAEAFERNGGYDERFDEPGGGFVNLDFYHRLSRDPNLDRIRLLGEGSFHQVHGGAATGLDPDTLTDRLERWQRQYERITGREYGVLEDPPALYGPVGRHALEWIRRSAQLWLLEGDPTSQ